MKKFIVNILVFLLFSGAFYIVSLAIWGRYAPSSLKPNINYRIGAYGHLYSRLSEVRKQKDMDIVFLGPSHAYRGFDTRVYSNKGIKTFNLGSSAQTPIQAKVLLDRYFETLNPKKVIYAVSPTIFSIDGVESSLDLIANDKNDWHSFKMALETNNIKTYNTFFYGITRDLLNSDESFTESIIKKNDRYIPGGFVEKEISYFKPIPFEMKEIDIKQVQLESFSEMVSKFKKNNIDLILVYTPVAPSYYNSYSNNSHFDSIMNSYSEYYNFNEIMSLSDSLYFYDKGHLNQNGVELFNTKLIEILNKR